MSTSEKTYGITLKDKIGYALGDAGGLLTFSLISPYQQKFYNSCLHIDGDHISVMLLIARIWDAINDPLWGGFIDSRKPTKYGRFRPYILGASFPLAICAVLMFTKIPGMSTFQYLVFAYISYILYGMMYTGTNIPYGSLASVVTSDEYERSSLSMFRSIGAGVGGLPGSMILPWIVNSVEPETGQKYLDANKLTPAVAVLALLSIGVYYLHFKMTKERIALPEQKQRQGMHMFSVIGDLMRNVPFIVLCIVSMLLIAFQMYTQNNYNYLLTDFYNKPELYMMVTVFTYLPMAMFIPFMNKIIRRFGKKEISAWGIGFAAVINFIMFFIGKTALVENPVVFLVMLFFSGMGQTFLVLEVWAMVMDVIDYHELLSGKREEGSAYSVYSFTRKMGQTLAGVGSAKLIKMIGYDKDSHVQSRPVLLRLYSISTLIPAIALLIMFLLLQFAYPLSKKKLAELKETQNNGE